MISAAVDTQGERFSQPAGGPKSLADLPNTVRPVVSQNPNLHDVRVLIPGYPQVMESDNPIHIVGELGGHAALPPCKIGRMDLADGLVIYVLICHELYEREGTPYGANNGRDWPDNHIRFARLGLAASTAQALHGQHVADGAADDEAHGADQCGVDQQAGRHPDEGADVGAWMAARCGGFAVAARARLPDQPGAADREHHGAQPGQEIGADAAVAGVGRNLQRAEGQACSDEQHARADDGLRANRGKAAGLIGLGGIRGKWIGL